MNFTLPLLVRVTDLLYVLTEGLGGVDMLSQFS